MRHACEAMQEAEENKEALPLRAASFLIEMRGKDAFHVMFSSLREEE